MFDISSVLVGAAVTCILTFSITKRAYRYDITNSKSYNKIQEQLCACNKDRLMDKKRYTHLKGYYVVLAGKFNDLRKRYSIMKAKMVELLVVHFGKEFVDKVAHNDQEDAEPVTESPRSDSALG